MVKGGNLCPAGKIYIGLHPGGVWLETRNLSLGCLRFFRLALLLVLDPLYFALVQDKIITRILPENACCTVHDNCPPPTNPHPIIHAFPFLNKQFTVYKFSIFYKHSNPNNQPYYYIITFTQYTKILLFLIDMKGK